MMTDVSERAAPPPPPPVDDCVYDPFYQFHGTPLATTTTTTTQPVSGSRLLLRLIRIQPSI